MDDGYNGGMTCINCQNKIEKALNYTRDLDIEREQLENEGEVAMGLIRKIIADNAQKAMRKAYCRRYSQSRERK